MFIILQTFCKPLANNKIVQPKMNIPRERLWGPSFSEIFIVLWLFLHGKNANLNKERHAYQGYDFFVFDQ